MMEWKSHIVLGQIALSRELFTLTGSVHDHPTLVDPGGLEQVFPFHEPVVQNKSYQG